ncbi:MAG: LD-carboxypeptidase [Deltaproteobacteria bacterium]|nr:LD-carboxypeptidase [Deltaproteobacteria bacterium]
MLSASAPPRLRPGDRVAVIAPSGPVSPGAVAAGLALLEARYRVVVDTSEETGIFARAGLFAGDDDRRAEELHRHLADPDVRAVFCARGGYGASRLLPWLDPAPLRADPKLLVGFSDITFLLAWALTAGVRGVHGPVVTQLGRLPAGDQRALFELLERPTPPPPLAGESWLPGSAAGPLLGGNLELLSRLLGTPWALPLQGALLFAEDVEERPYRIDRTLTHLEQAGGLGQVAGLALGDFLRCDPATGAPPVTAREVLLERARELHLPLLGGLPVGHGERNVALPFGGRAHLEAGALVFDQAAVA